MIDRQRLKLGASLAQLDTFIAEVRTQAPPDAYIKIDSHYGEPSDYLSFDICVPVGIPEPGPPSPCAVVDGIVERSVPCNLDELEHYVAEIRRLASDTYTAGKIHSTLDDHSKLLCRLRYPDASPDPGSAVDTFRQTGVFSYPTNRGAIRRLFRNARSCQ